LTSYSTRPAMTTITNNSTGAPRRTLFYTNRQILVV
jgi:hypothetical protein